MCKYVNYLLFILFTIGCDCVCDGGWDDCCVCDGGWDDCCVCDGVCDCESFNNGNLFLFTYFVDATVLGSDFKGLCVGVIFHK